MSDTFQCPHCGQQYAFQSDLVGKAAKCAQCGTLFHAVVVASAAEAPPHPVSQPTHVEPPPPPPSRDDSEGLAGILDLDLDQVAARPAGKGHAKSAKATVPVHPVAKSAPPPMPGLIPAQTLGLAVSQPASGASLLDEEFSRLEALASAPQVLGSGIAVSHRSQFKFLRSFRLVLRQDEKILLYVAVIASLLGMAISLAPALGLHRFSWGFSTVLSTVGFLMGLMGSGLAGYALQRNSNLRMAVVGVLVTVLLAQFILVGRLRGPDPSEPVTASRATDEDSPRPEALPAPVPAAGGQENDTSAPPPLPVVPGGDDRKASSPPASKGPGSGGLRLSEEIANAPEVNPSTEPPPSGRPATIWNAKRTPGQGQTYYSIEYRLKLGTLMADTPVQWVIEDDEGQTTFLYVWGRLSAEGTLQKPLPDSRLGDALRRRGSFKTWLERAQPRRELISNVLTFVPPVEEK